MPFELLREPYDQTNVVVRVELATPANDTLLTQFEEYVEAALSFLVPYADSLDSSEEPGKTGDIAQVTRNGREMTAWVQDVTTPTQPG